MDQKAVFKLCKSLGCCDACSLRYLGLKHPNVYENSQKYSLRYQETSECDTPADNNTETKHGIEHTDTKDHENGSGPNKTDSDEHKNGPPEQTGDHENGPPTKRKKGEICVSCLGVLQNDTWPEANQMVKDMLQKKGYECSSFACALSAPIATLPREHAVIQTIKQEHEHYDAAAVTPLKEAWKWSFGSQLERHVGLALDSGAVAPLLVTVTLEYPDEQQELEILKVLSPSLFESRSAQKKRFSVEFTRRSVEQALGGVTRAALSAAGWVTVPAARTRAKCVSVLGMHAPLYLGGRYVKLSRCLPQTPWLVSGVRVMDSSVQEIIFEPLAEVLRISVEEAEHRLKFMSSGREDVDVRCLGDGRPFAVEVSDPRRAPSAGELRAVCERAAATGLVRLTRLVPVTREDLADLKKGEESKCKSYEALCIKLSHSEHEKKSPSDPIEVTPEDIANINSYSNSSIAGVRVSLQQRTPIRVLHRRPLLTRTREIYELSAALVPGHPQLFVVRVRCAAGTYVKEWAHGELGRTRPPLGHALRATTDLLALDVAAVHLHWPDNKLHEPYNDFHLIRYDTSTYPLISTRPHAPAARTRAAGHHRLAGAGRRRRASTLARQ